MKPKSCKEFLQWLERLPRTELSPSFSKHLNECESCRREWESLNELSESLLSIPNPIPLDKQVIQDIVMASNDAVCRRLNHILAWRLGVLSLFCLPLVIAINCLWAFLGYSLLMQYASPLWANSFLIFFTLTATCLTGVSYGAIPLLAGWLGGQSREEVQNVRV
jgi:hypothetical protein